MKSKIDLANEMPRMHCFYAIHVLPNYRRSDLIVKMNLRVSLSHTPTTPSPAVFLFTFKIRSGARKGVKHAPDKKNSLRNRFIKRCR